MKAHEWQLFLQDQRDRYAKVLFTPTELANVDQGSGDSTRVTLQRLVSRGVLERYSDGRYGLHGAVRVEDLVPSLDAAAYATGMYSLYRHRFTTQAPMEIRCFTNRRHNRSRRRRTPFGSIVFVCLTSAVYRRPEGTVIAPPEQALFDFVYECRRQGLPPEGLVTFRHLARLDRELLANISRRYPATVVSNVAHLVALAR